MAFYKKVKRKINDKWYASAVTVGKPVTTDEVADRLAQISTVSRADTYAVLKDLAGVLADYMANGRTVKLDGLGTFYYTCDTSKMGMDKPELVTAKQIKGARVRFIPETRMSGQSAGRTATRTLVSQNIFWEEWGGSSSSDTTTTDTSTGGNTASGSQDDSGLTSGDSDDAA